MSLTDTETAPKLVDDDERGVRDGPKVDGPPYGWAVIVALD